MFFCFLVRFLRVCMYICYVIVDTIAFGTYRRQFHWIDGFHLSHSQASVRIESKKLKLFIKFVKVNLCW